MKRILILGMSLLMLVGCDFWPEPLALVPNESVTEYELLVGDTLRIPILDGPLYEVTDWGDTNTVQVQRIASATLYIGRRPGISLIRLDHYQGPESQRVAVEYMLFRVYDLHPLDLYVNEPDTLLLADLFNTGILSAADSMSYQLTSGAATDLMPVLDSAGIRLFASWPGYDTLGISLYDGGVFLEEQRFGITATIRKVVMLELFTNSSCPNCPPANHAVDQLLEQFDKNLAVVRYHPDWFVPQDPMALINPVDVTARAMALNVFLAPWMAIDGTSHTTVDEDAWAAEITSRINAGTHLIIALNDVAVAGDSLAIDYTIQTIEPSLSTSYTAYTVVTEDSIAFDGHNGETLFMQVMRDSELSSGVGVDSSASTHINHTLMKPEGDAADGRFSLVVFLVDEASGTIEQALRQFILF